MNSPGYFDRVEAYTERAKSLYPGRNTFTKAECARIAEKSPQTIYNNPERYRFTSRRISIKEFTRMEMTR